MLYLDQFMSEVKVFKSFNENWCYWALQER